MGLAPYGEPKYVDRILAELLHLQDDGTFRLDMDFFHFATGLTMTSGKFDELLACRRERPSRPSPSARWTSPARFEIDLVVADVVQASVVAQQGRGAPGDPLEQTADLGVGGNGQLHDLRAGIEISWRQQIGREYGIAERSGPASLSNRLQPHSPVARSAPYVRHGNDTDLVGQLHEDQRERKAANHEPAYPESARHTWRQCLGLRILRHLPDGLLDGVEQVNPQLKTLRLEVVPGDCPGKFLLRLYIEADWLGHRRGRRPSISARTAAQSFPFDSPLRARRARASTSVAHAASASASGAPSMLATNSAIRTARSAMGRASASSSTWRA